ncbi:YutD family protein [Alkalibacterium pelagium]|uniref:Uncharacterized protein YutD n=1 Tax=Alkalibacterium pelagium TaxID=426702 RepID=A0A1H7FIC8_9LACT|nr:YutD family protein [Alkalibacterium pelagium]GEN49348.1 hypothetical protein APE02nite_00130 [Alkalibacterium pelagium]SEK25729.1 Uncharacterized protein YutD [Alkalibacterium pelagium]
MTDNKEKNIGRPGTEDKIEELVRNDEKVVKKLDAETLEIAGDKYSIKENYREALDLELLEDRYSDLLEKYDFIVGDMSYGKLRLRGFYHDSNKKAPIDMKIGHLEDYLSEYCSFGCAYFVLESLETKKKQRSYPNPDPQFKQSQKKPQKRRSEKSRRKSSGQKQNQPTRSKPAKDSPKKPSHEPQKKSNESAKKKTDKKSFTKKSRSESKPNTKKTEKVKEVKNEKGSTRFQIRKKK